VFTTVFFISSLPPGIKNELVAKTPILHSPPARPELCWRKRSRLGSLGNSLAEK